MFKLIQSSNRVFDICNNLQCYKKLDYMNDTKISEHIFEHISVKDLHTLQQEVKSLRMEISRLQMENCDLENSLLTAVEHGDLVEDELLEVNKKLKGEIIERKMAQATLQSILEIVYRDKNDLEIMLSTATEHGDVIEYEQYNRAVEAMRESEEQLRQQASLLEHRVEQRTCELNEAKEIAEAASLSKAAFLANMSHELRTPLNAILGFAQLMLYDQELNEQHQNDLQTICNSGNHLLSMINDILEMSRLEAGGVLLRERECYLYDIVDTAKDMLALKADEKKLLFDFNIHPDSPEYIYLDEGKLRQILINLISNAIKFTDAGHIYIRVFPEDLQLIDQLNQQIDQESSENYQCLCFEVEDTGLGISELEIPTLFQPFVQTDSGRRSQEGTGLGLSISYNYIKLMGGQMSVTSKVGSGSTFRFTIPIKSLNLFSKDAPIKSTNRVIGIEKDQPTYRILIAEDVRLNRQLLTRILLPLGFEVREVSNGQEAIAVWQSWSPHLIWMDVRMPILNGHEATSAIRGIESERGISASQKVKIIALTASLVDFREEDLYLYGFDGFVCKPFTEDKLFARMSEHLKLQYIYSH